jgi:hypothetical protein
MSNLFRRYLDLTLRRHKAGFLLTLLMIFLIGAGLVIFARTYLKPETEPWFGLSAGFGDALVIAAVVALLVDPVAQEQFAREWGHDLYWAIFSPNAPQAFRHALEKLAAPDAYIEKCTHILTIDHTEGTPDEVLTLNWHIWIDGIALDRRKPLAWDGRVFVVPRHDGEPSLYTYWSFKVDGADRVEFSGEQLKNLDVVRYEPSGRCVLDQSKLPEVDQVDFGKKFSSERHVLTTRLRTDYLPLFQPKMVLKHKIIVRGAAASELDFYIMQLGGDLGEVKFKRETRPGGLEQQSLEHDTVAFPGQTTLLFWSPKAKTTAPTPIEATRTA